MKVNEIIDERALLIRLCNGDHQAFERLYHHYKRRIVGHLLVLFNDELRVLETRIFRENKHYLFPIPFQELEVNKQLL